MTTFKIKLVSQTNAAILILALMTIFFVSRRVFFPPEVSSIVSILMISFWIATTYLLWQQFVTGRTEWTIDETGITINWTKKFAWIPGDNVNLSWTEIEDISKGPDPQYYTLRIKLISGKTIKYYHDTLTTGDDFGELIKVLFQAMSDKKSKV